MILIHTALLLPRKTFYCQSLKYLLNVTTFIFGLLSHLCCGMHHHIQCIKQLNISQTITSKHSNCCNHSTTVIQPALLILGLILTSQRHYVISVLLHGNK